MRPYLSARCPSAQTQQSWTPASPPRWTSRHSTLLPPATGRAAGAAPRSLRAAHSCEPSGQRGTGQPFEDGRLLSPAQGWATQAVGSVRSQGQPAAAAAVSSALMLLR